VNEFKAKAKKFRKRYSRLERDISHAALMGSHSRSDDLERGQRGRGSLEQQDRLMQLNGRADMTTDRLQSARRDMQEVSNAWFAYDQPDSISIYLFL
jgi:predicted  nucleic acid-binding Zn-ribbon protein